MRRLTVSVMYIAKSSSERHISITARYTFDMEWPLSIDMGPNLKCGIARTTAGSCPDLQLKCLVTVGRAFKP